MHGAALLMVMGSRAHSAKWLKAFETPQMQLEVEGASWKRLLPLDSHPWPQFLLIQLMKNKKKKPENVDHEHLVDRGWDEGSENGVSEFSTHTQKSEGQLMSCKFTNGPQGDYLGSYESSSPRKNFTATTFPPPLRPSQEPTGGVKPRY